MPKVNFVGFNGTVHSVDGDDGQSVMEIARAHDIPGIVADCGGSMSCATCHVYIPEDWLDQVGRATGDEAEMLELAVNPEENSRLSCQVIVNDAVDGLVVNLPKSQF